MTLLVFVVLTVLITVSLLPFLLALFLGAEWMLGRRAVRKVLPYRRVPKLRVVRGGKPDGGSDEVA